MQTTRDQDTSRAYQATGARSCVWWFCTDARPAARHYLHGNSARDVCDEVEARRCITQELLYAHEATEGLRVWPFRPNEDTVREVNQ
jgi:hypothetical protein